MTTMNQLMPMPLIRISDFVPAYEARARRWAVSRRQPAAFVAVFSPLRSSACTRARRQVGGLFRRKSNDRRQACHQSDHGLRPAA